MKKTLSLLLLAATLIIACKKSSTSNTNSSTAIVTTIAGSGVQGNINGTGTTASFYNPTGIAVDAGGNVYVADQGNHLIRKITPSGVVSTLAGSGILGNVNGTGTAASFNWLEGLAVDAAGNVYVADTLDGSIRKITPAGVVSTLAKNGSYDPTSVAVDATGNVYMADDGNNLIRKINPTGVVSTFAGSGVQGNSNGTGAAASFYYPDGVAVDNAGNVYVTDQAFDLIRKISPLGVVSTLAGSGVSGNANGIGTAASFRDPTCVAVDATGNVYVGDTGNGLIRKISPAGMVSTITAIACDGIAVDATGNLYVTGGNNLIRKIVVQ